MLPMNLIEPEPAAAAEGSGSGVAVALLGGWLGGLALGGLLLANGFGWLAALAGYVLGGALLVLGLALFPLVEMHQPVPRPVYARVRRRS